MHRAFDTLAWSASFGAIGSAFGAITNDQVVTWVGVAIAIGSAVGSTAISTYQKWKAAVREERAADAAAAIIQAAKLAEHLAEFEARVDAIDARLAVGEGRASRPKPRRKKPEAQ